MSILFYKRPDYIAKEDGPLNLTSCQKYVDRAQSCKAAIPPELSFDKIMAGKTKPPASLNDFMDYLVYVAHDAENLQFYLWLLDYTKRFDALPQSEQSLSPYWKFDEAVPLLTHAATARGSDKALETLGIKQMTSFYEEEHSTSADRQSRSSMLSPTYDSFKSDEARVAEANAQAGLKWQSFTIQPFRKEITMITSHYITPSSPRELNLSHKDRAAVLHALQHTTHPSTFAPLLRIIELSLRTQSHQNFVRWSICNGNKPRVVFLRSLAVSILSLGLVVVVLLILSRRSRYLRLVVAPIWWFGITNLVAAYKGLCVLLHRQNVREIHPWELDEPRPSFNLLGRSPDPRPDRPSPRPESVRSSTPLHRVSKPLPQPSVDLESQFGLSPASSFTDEKLAPLGPGNAYGHEPWVSRWSTHSTWRKLGLRKVWVQEDALRVVQNRIIWQAELWAVIILVPVLVGVVTIPVGGLY